MNETENNGRIDDKDRVFRGGSWYNHSIYCRAALRDRDAPGFRSVDLGLRLVVPTPRNKE